MPVFDHAAIAHDVDVDTGNLELLPSRRHAHEAPAVSARVLPAHHDLVALRDDILDGELERVEGRVEPCDSCFEIGEPVSLPWERIVLEVVLGRDLVEDAEPALVENLVVVAPDDRLVVADCHDLPPMEVVLVADHDAAGVGGAP